MSIGTRSTAAWVRSCAASLGLTLGLAGCGGGGSSSPPPPPAPTVKAVDDEYTVPAGIPSALNVQANDTASGGTPALSVGSAPAHGKLAVQGGTLQYTPDAGFYGTDQFTYRAELEGTSTTATVKLTVEAELELSGSIAAASAAGLEVTAQAGDQQFKTTVDAQGAYKLKVRSSRPDAFVTLTAHGSGTRSWLAFGSLVGDFASLTALPSAPLVGQAQWPELKLDALSSARQGLLKLRGIKPANSAQLRSVFGRLNEDDVLDTLLLFRHAAEDGAVLPDGVATTLDLVGDTAALTAFRTPWDNWNDPVPGTAFTRARLQLTPATEIGVVQVGAQGRQLALPASRYSWYYGMYFDLRGDGTATVFMNFLYFSNPPMEARWSYDGDALTITLEKPTLVVSTEYSAFQLKQVRRTDGSPKLQLMIRELSRGTYCPGPSPANPTGACPVTRWQPWNTRDAFDANRDKLAFEPTDFTASPPWAGLSAKTDSAAAACLCTPDMFDFKGTMNLPGLSGQLVDGSLQLNGPDFAYRYTRLRQGADGIEWWLAEVEQNGKRVNARIITVGRATAVSSDLKAASRRWVIRGDPDRLDPSNGLYSYGDQKALHQDGSWGGFTTIMPGRWTLSSDGQLITIYDGTSYRLVGRINGDYLAISDDRELVRMRDFGPAD